MAWYIVDDRKLDDAVRIFDSDSLDPSAIARLYGHDALSNAEFIVQAVKAWRESNEQY